MQSYVVKRFNACLQILNAELVIMLLDVVHACECICLYVTSNVKFASVIQRHGLYMDKLKIANAYE